MKAVSIKVTDRTSGSTETASAQFEDSEIVLFDDYLANADRLHESTILREGNAGSLSIRYDADTGFGCDVTLPDEESICAFLHRLRSFILNDERSSYNKIAGILGKRFENSTIRAMIKNHRKIYDGREFQKMIVIESNGVTINSEKMLFDWLNAFEFHNDGVLQAEIEKLHQMMPLDSSRAVFLMLLIEKVKAIDGIADFIRVLRGANTILETKA